jgi:hypothetical protein
MIQISNQTYGIGGGRDILGDPVIARAILDRVLPPATTINIRAERDRLKEKKKAGLPSHPREESTPGVA